MIPKNIIAEVECENRIAKYILDVKASIDDKAIIAAPWKGEGEYRQGTIISVYYGVGMFEHLSLVVPHDFEFNGEKAVITKNGKVFMTSENSKMLKALYENLFSTSYITLEELLKRYRIKNVKAFKIEKYLYAECFDKFISYVFARSGYSHKNEDKKLSECQRDYLLEKKIITPNEEESVLITQEEVREYTDSSLNKSEDIIVAEFKDFVKNKVVFECNGKKYYPLDQHALMNIMDGYDQVFNDLTEEEPVKTIEEENNGFDIFLSSLAEAGILPDDEEALKSAYENRNAEEIVYLLSSELDGGLADECAMLMDNYLRNGKGLSRVISILERNEEVIVNEEEDPLKERMIADIEQEDYEDLLICVNAVMLRNNDELRKLVNGDE